MTSIVPPCARCLKLEEIILSQQNMFANILDTLARHDVTITFLTALTSNQHNSLLTLKSNYDNISAQVESHHACLQNTMAAVQTRVM